MQNDQRGRNDDSRSYGRNDDDWRGGAAFHHETAAYHHRQAARSRSMGNDQDERNHGSMALHHGEMANRYTRGRYDDDFDRRYGSDRGSYGSDRGYGRSDRDRYGTDRGYGASDRGGYDRSQRNDDDRRYGSSGYGFERDSDRGGGYGRERNAGSNDDWYDENRRARSAGH